MTRPDLKIGCCGFPVARERYYQKFKVVEVQQTFYQPPRIATVKKWRQQAPVDFEFTVKAWQLITHNPASPTYRRLKLKIEEVKRTSYGFFQPTREVLQAWEQVDLIASALRAKIVLFQSPASFRPEKTNVDNLRRFFKTITRRNYLFVWEPRGGWPEPLIKKLCTELRLIHGVDPFKNEPLSGGIRYFRLHGITGYRYKYTDSDLKNLRNFCPPAVTSYVMFNNTGMWPDADRFRRLLPTKMTGQ